MNRLSQRISTVWSLVKCPRCGTLVQPQPELSGIDPQNPGVDQNKRWSFLWTLPRGDFCPECEFPLSKYFGRLKWIRTMMVGVAIVLLALVLQLIGVGLTLGMPYVRFMRGTILVGAAVVAVGLLGVLIGGRHKAVRVTGKN